MLIRIVILEDIKAHCDRITSVLNSWAENAGHNLHIKCFNNPIAIDESEISKYDCIISDVKMPGQDGISFAREIRKVNLSVPIIFISDYVEYALSGYEVNALRFLNKNDPNFTEKLYECMDFTAKTVESNIQKGYTVINGGEHISLMFRDILYIEARNHTITFFTPKIALTERKTISALVAELPEQFCQCSRSHIVNVQHIVRFSSDSIKLRSGDEVPLTKTFAAELMKRYAKYH